MGYAAKAIVAAITAFLGFVAAKEVGLDPFVEAGLLALVAALTVYVTPNSAR